MITEEIVDGTKVTRLNGVEVFWERSGSSSSVDIISVSAGRMVANLADEKLTAEHLEAVGLVTRKVVGALVEEINQRLALKIPRRQNTSLKG